MTAIYPVILCGGSASGTRLWRLDRKSLPAPFSPLASAETLFEQALGRVVGHDHFAPPMVVAGTAQADMIMAQLSAAPGARLVLEPAARNTAPAIALAAALLPQEAVMLVCPSDHHIADASAFRAAALAAAALARQDYLVSFGIAPERADIGYGYLECGEPLLGGYAVARFIEKPDLAQARVYLASGRFSWNGGIFAFRAGRLLDELAVHRPDMARLVKQAVAEGSQDGARFYPAPEPFAAIEGISIDYAVMENTARAAMVPANMGWSDIGQWAALVDRLANSADLQDKSAREGSIHRDWCPGVFALTDGSRISAIRRDNVCLIVSGTTVLVTTRDGTHRVGKLPGIVFP